MPVPRVSDLERFPEVDQLYGRCLRDRARDYASCLSKADADARFAACARTMHSVADATRYEATLPIYDDLSDLPSWWLSYLRSIQQGAEVAHTTFWRM